MSKKFRYYLMLISLIIINPNIKSDWTQQYIYPFIDLRSLYIIDANTVFTVGTNGYILKTTNGGQNWVQKVSGTTLNLTSVFFVNTNWGYIVGCGPSSYSIFLKTTDGGNNWSQNINNSYWFQKILFVNSTTGFIVGDTLFTNKAIILKTTNGGLNWINQVANIFPNPLIDVDFVNEFTGWAVGVNRRIIKTTNGGNNWSSQIQDSANRNLYTVFFIDEYTGWTSEVNGIIYKTTNGGSSWLQYFVNSGNQCLFFLNSTVGWSAGFSGVHLTTNGGINWSYQNVMNFSREIEFLNLSTGWVVGDLGVIYKTTDGGGYFSGINLINGNLPKYYLLSQNYPNPFNPITKISFSIPPLKGAGGMIGIKLIIYDILGREVATIVNEQLKPGTYEVDWDGSNYSSGVYFYSLITNEFAQTKKLILLK